MCKKHHPHSPSFEGHFFKKVYSTHYSFSSSHPQFRQHPWSVFTWAFLVLRTSDLSTLIAASPLDEPFRHKFFFFNPYSDFSVTYILLLRPRFLGLLIISISVRVTLPSSRRDYRSRFLLLLLLNGAVELCLQQICWLMLEHNIIDRSARHK